MASQKDQPALFLLGHV